MDSSRLTLKEIEEELHRRLHDDPLGLVYKPHSFQTQVHKSRRPVTLVIGGNRSGKTYGAVAEALYYCLGRTVYGEIPTPPVTVWYVMPSLTMFKRSVMPVMDKLLPRKEVKRWAQRARGGVIHFKNGSQLHLLSADMRQRRLQGASVDFVVMDETPDEDVYEELQARVFDRSGRILLVFSPIDASTMWVRDKIYIPWQAGDKQDVDIVHMPVADREGRSLVPQYTSEDIKRLERQWPDPNVRAARMYGEFIVRAGLVFKSFVPDIHVIKPFKVPDEYARWFICDPEYHRFAVLYFAADDKGNYYITDEYFSQDETLSRRAEKVSFMVGERERAIPMYVDSANPQDTAELNWHFSRLGIPAGATPLPMQKQVEKFILRTHALLEPNDERKYPKITGLGDCFGAPRLFFFDTLSSTWRWEERAMRCSRLVWELQRLSWDKNGKPDKDSADGSDCSDCLIYGCSILAAGARAEEGSAWEKNLPVGDVLLWKAIERHDSMKKLTSWDY